MFGCTGNSEGGVWMIAYLNKFWTLLLFMRGHLIPVQIYYYLCNNNNSCIYIIVIISSTRGTAMIINPLLSPVFIDKEEPKRAKPWALAKCQLDDISLSFPFLENKTQTFSLLAFHQLSSYKIVEKGCWGKK